MTLAELSVYLKLEMFTDVHLGITPTEWHKWAVD